MKPDLGFFLFIAAQSGRVEVARVLLEHGADINRQAQGRTALKLAEHFGHVEVAALLRAHGAM